MEPLNLSPEAREAKRKYEREYQRRRRAAIRQQKESYWERKAKNDQVRGAN